jgi:hypothetical protein
MKDVLKGLFNPAKQATGAFGNLGGLGGERGASFGHLGEDFGSYNEYKDTDHFDLASHYNPSNHYDPEKLLKRY